MTCAWFMNDANPHDPHWLSMSVGTGTLNLLVDAAMASNLLYQAGLETSAACVAERERVEALCAAASPSQPSRARSAPWCKNVTISDANWWAAPAVDLLEGSDPAWPAVLRISLESEPHRLGVRLSAVAYGDLLRRLEAVAGPQLGLGPHRGVVRGPQRVSRPTPVTGPGPYELWIRVPTLGDVLDPDAPAGMAPDLAEEFDDLLVRGHSRRLLIERLAAGLGADWAWSFEIPRRGMASFSSVAQYAASELQAILVGLPAEVHALGLHLQCGLVPPGGSGAMDMNGIELIRGGLYWSDRGPDRGRLPLLRWTRGGTATRVAGGL